jgi:hypothetical protein
MIPSLRHVFATLTLLLAISAPQVADAVEFRPFAKVKDVCPTCPKRATDLITMDNGTKVSGRVVAQSDAFFVIALYGELRAVPIGRVTSVTWANGSQPPGLTSQDQILLNNGTVFTGTIIQDNEKPSFYRIQSSINKQTYVVFKSQAKMVVRAGKVQSK